MIFRDVSESGDWEWGQGRQSYATGARAIDLNIKTALMIFLGEVFWNTEAGVDWLNLIGGKNPTARQGIILQCRQVIITRYGVARINSVNSDFSNYRRNLNVTYDITTIYGTTLISSLNGSLAGGNSLSFS